MSDMIAFLRARLDEDEAAARAVAGHELFDGTGIVVMHTHASGTRSVTLPSHVARFAARWDPARVLAEVAAKRAIIELHAPIPEDDLRLRAGSCTSCGDQGCCGHDEEYPCATLKAIAQPYADHPDFDPAWRP